MKHRVFYPLHPAYPGVADAVPKPGPVFQKKATAATGDTLPPAERALRNHRKRIAKASRAGNRT